MVTYVILEYTNITLFKVLCITIVVNYIDKKYIYR